MPELPEVHTTTKGLKRFLPGLKIKDVWSDLPAGRQVQKKDLNNIKNPTYYRRFKDAVVGKKVKDVIRRGKNILIILSDNETLIIHMKMTGHLLYGKYERAPRLRSGQTSKEVWVATEEGPLRDDKFNGHIRHVFSLSDGMHLAFSDMRKFAKIALYDKVDMGDPSTNTLNTLGPDPLKVSVNTFMERLQRRPNMKIKQALLDQSLLSGIGNIYADETLWASAVHPERRVLDLRASDYKKMHSNAQRLLKKGVRLRGDSMSDYRNVDGRKGKFQMEHKAYKHKGEPCSKRGCPGTIARIVVASRGTHYCPVHQK